MEKKYKFSGETKEWRGHTLHRIEALRSFGNVKQGDKGGWIESESNLSQEGCCWVDGGAIVRDNAYVYGNARLSGCALVCGDAAVCDNAMVFGNAVVRGEAVVRDNAMVFGNAKVRGYAEVCDHAVVCGDAVIEDNSDFLVFRNFWSSNRFFTWTKSNDMWKVGCFHGTGKELIEKAYADDEEKGKFYQKYVEFVETLKKC